MRCSDGGASGRWSVTGKLLPSEGDVLRPVIQDIYGRLDPHPAFTRLRFAVEVYREKGIASPHVNDAHGGVVADPLLIFSSSQANVVALSAFLALGWASGRDSMPFLLLDDLCSRSTTSTCSASPICAGICVTGVS